MSQSCIWPYGIIYEKPELLVEDVLGNDCSEVLTIEAVTGGCLTDPNSKPCADRLSTDHFSAWTYVFTKSSAWG